MAYESDPIARKLNDLAFSADLHMSLMFFEDLNPAERAVIGTWELANEVYNGGFTQYFHNSSRDRAKPMVDVLRLIEAPRAALILESAIALAGPGTRWGDEPNSIVAIKSMPENIKKELRQLESDLYDELDAVHRQVFRFLSEHRDQIDAPADFWTEPTIQ